MLNSPWTHLRTIVIEERWLVKVRFCALQWSPRSRDRLLCWWGWWRRFSRNEYVEMGKRKDQVGSHQKWRHQEGGARKTRWNFPRKQNTKVVSPLLEATTQPYLCEIAKTIGFWEKEQRPTEKEMEGQHTGRHEEIPTDWRHGTRLKILDD